MLPVFDPVVVLESLAESAAKLAASSNRSVAATVSSIGTELLELQVKKGEVRWLGGGPLTNANEQPPKATARAAIARGPSGFRRGKGDLTKHWASKCDANRRRWSSIVILGATL